MQNDNEKRAARRKRRRRRIIFYSVAALVIAAMFLVHHFFLKRPVGRGPAGPPVHREPFERIWTERKAFFLGLGDSITEGYGASPGKSYFDRLLRNPDDEFADMQGVCLSSVLPNLAARSWATSGSTSLDHLERQVSRLQEQPAEVFGIVVMTTGGNDIIHDYGRSPPEECAMYGATLDQARPWIRNFEARLETMLDLIAKTFPGGCEIFLANIYDPTDGIGTAHTVGFPSWRDGLGVLGEYNAVIRRVAEERGNVHLVDLHALFLGHGLACAHFWRATYRPDDPHYWYGEVFEDPNDRGYDATRRAFLLKMIEVFKENYPFEPNPQTFAITIHSTRGSAGQTSGSPRSAIGFCGAGAPEL